ncbi:hypothetical protein HA466_0267540 [Hirschfeldia incana]|nr:hypothetical protein HA466_0267540 [Hirschfeldia incana]
MGCVSSKLVKKKPVREIRVNNGGDHIVSLTSTTYGHLNIDQRAETSPKSHELNKGEAFESEPIKPRRSTARGDDPEIINTWELMKDLEDSTKISPKARGILSWKTPAKPSLESPKRNGSSKRFRGKENRGLSPNQVPKRGVMRLSFPLKTEEAPVAVVTQRRKSFSPMFDPELVASYERELCEEKEQIKMVISSSSGKTEEKNREAERLLSSFPEKCPPGGEDTVVVYITTLRGVRKTFEDCNAVRSVLDSHEVRFSERDVSMHSVFKEEIRGILGKVKIPAVFVKGRMVGGVEEVMKLEEEGELGILLECMPKQRLGGGSCCGCGGMRFVMCDVCNGSCKVLDGEKKGTVKCLVCNENGLVLCPICS